MRQPQIAERQTQTSQFRNLAHLQSAGRDRTHSGGHDVSNDRSQETWSAVTKRDIKLFDSAASKAAKLKSVRESRTCCTFCFKNGETAEVFTSHSLQALDGTVSCPKLRSYKCTICSYPGGDHAHTRKYCPLVRKRSLPGSAANLVKNSINKESQR